MTASPSSAPPIGTPFDLTVNLDVSGWLDAIQADPFERSRAQVWARINMWELPEWEVSYLFVLNEYDFDPLTVRINTLLPMTLNISAGDPFVLSYRLQLEAWGVASADFLSTATLSFDLPDGTSISSSGGFIQSATPVPEPIPEPTTMLLLGSGLIGLAAYGRKKFFKK